MRLSQILMVFLILSAGNDIFALEISFITTGKYNRVINADRWCAGSDWAGNGECNNCMNEQWAEPFAPWLDNDSIIENDGPWCNTIDPATTLLGYMYDSGDWTKFALLLTSTEQLSSAIDNCGLDFNNSEHVVYGYDCEDYFGALEGTMIGGFGIEISAVLAPRIDPSQGPPTGDEIYPFLMDFTNLQTCLSDMVDDPIYNDWSPWRIVFSASLRDWEETQDEQALWNMAHALPCWQSTRNGWEGGRNIIEIMPDGYPEWNYDWTDQPTYLFYLYSAVISYIEATVPTREISWDSLKAMYR